MWTRFLENIVGFVRDVMAYGYNDDKTKFDLNSILGDFATVETGSAASRAYAAGDYLIHDNKLYMAVTGIAAGGSFVVGTNIIESAGVLDELQKWYALPCTNGHASGHTTWYGLTINPALKLMCLSFGTTETTGTVTYAKVLTDLPVIKTLANPTEHDYTSPLHFRKISMFGISETGESMQASAEIRNVNASGDDASAAEWDHSVITVIPRLTANIQYSGSLIVPYQKMSTAHPFSEARLLTV